MNIIEDFGETLIVPSLEELEQLNIWTKESRKSDLTIQLTVKKNSDNSLNIQLDDIHVL